MKYRAEIDGLRTIAVIPVILFHLGYDWISGGYLGVDVFFVISGFLITSIIVKELEVGTFSFVGFWERRVKRIMPALTVVVLTTLIIAPFVSFSDDVPLIARDAFAAIFSYANFNALAQFGDYWGVSAENSFFLHAWSLSVEEQFYILYPLFIFGIFKYKKSYPKLILGVIILSLILFIYGMHFYSKATFYMLPTRAWELAAGGLVATIPQSTLESKRRNVLALFGLLLILFSYFINHSGDGIDFITALPVIGASLIIHYSTDRRGIGIFLSNKVMVYIGRLSYSLYLWHWPIIVLFNSPTFEFSPIAKQSCILTITFLLSFLSYQFVENYTRKWKHTVKLAGSLMVLILLLGFFAKSQTYFKDTSSFEKVEFFGLYYDIVPTIKDVSSENKAKRDGIIAPSRPADFELSYAHEGIRFNENKTTDPNIVILGDSHGAMWAKTIHEIAKQKNLNSSFFTSVGTSPLFNMDQLEQQKKAKGFTADERVAYAQAFTKKIKKWKPEILVIVCRWDNFKKDSWTNLKKLLQFTQELEIKVVFFNQPPVIDIVGNRNMGKFLSYLGFTPNGGKQYIKIHDASQVKNGNETLLKLSNEFQNVVYFDTYSTFYNGQNKSLVINKNEVLYYDDDHISQQGATLLYEKISSLIDSVCALQNESIISNVSQ